MNVESTHSARVRVRQDRLNLSEGWLLSETVYRHLWTPDNRHGSRENHSPSLCKDWRLVSFGIPCANVLISDRDIGGITHRFPRRSRRTATTRPKENPRSFSIKAMRKRQSQGKRGLTCSWHRPRRSSHFNRIQCSVTEDGERRGRWHRCHPPGLTKRWEGDKELRQRLTAAEEKAQASFLVAESYAR